MMSKTLAVATKSEALRFSEQIQSKVKTLESGWWELAKLVDSALQRRVPAALDLSAREWMGKYLAGSVSDAFRKLRIARGLRDVPAKQLEGITEGNAFNLVRLPDRLRTSDKWLEKAKEMPLATFRSDVDAALGISHETFGAFVLRAPKDIIAELEKAESKVAGMLSLDIESTPGLRIEVWERIAGLVNGTEESHLLVEIQGGGE